METVWKQMATDIREGTFGSGIFLDSVADHRRGALEWRAVLSKTPMSELNPLSHDKLAQAWLVCCNVL